MGGAYYGLSRHPSRSEVWSWSPSSRCCAGPFAPSGALGGVTKSFAFSSSLRSASWRAGRSSTASWRSRAYWTPLLQRGDADHRRSGRLFSHHDCSASSSLSSTSSWAPASSAGSSISWRSIRSPGRAEEWATVKAKRALPAPRGALTVSCVWQCTLVVGKLSSPT